MPLEAPVTTATGFASVDVMPPTVSRGEGAVRLLRLDGGDHPALGPGSEALGTRADLLERLDLRQPGKAAPRPRLHGGDDEAAEEVLEDRLLVPVRRLDRRGHGDDQALLRDHGDALTLPAVRHAGSPVWRVLVRPPVQP